MKTVALLIVGLVVCALSVFAGEYLANDTLRDAFGLRVIFSQPVTLKGFGDAVMTVEPEGESSEFVFSGGNIQPWSEQWLAWEPLSAKILSRKWLAEGDSLSSTSLDDLEIHQVNNTSLQGKHGFQVVRLWASILRPNTRNLYRKVIDISAIQEIPYSLGG